METRELIQDLYRHMEWADAAVWTAVLASEAAEADEDLLERLRHFHLTQHAFLQIWRDEPVDPRAGAQLDAPALAGWVRQNHQAIRNYLASVPEGMLAGPVVVPWARQLEQYLGFEPPPTTLADTLIQVYAHTMHHRAQVAARLRALESEPPTVDYIFWVWTGRPEAVWT